MKNFSFFLAALVILSIFASCKKSYTCECSTTVNALGSSQTTTSTTDIKDYSWKAKAECEGKNNSVSLGYGIGTETSCKLQ